MSKAHGSRSRYQSGCRCVACCRYNNKNATKPDGLRWSLRFLYLHGFSKELVSDSIGRVLGITDLTTIKDIGLDDYEADRIAVYLGDHPMAIWPGWIEAGMDHAEQG